MCDLLERQMKAVGVLQAAQAMRLARCSRTSLKPPKSDTLVRFQEILSALRAPFLLVLLHCCAFLPILCMRTYFFFKGEKARKLGKRRQSGQSSFWFARWTMATHAIISRAIPDCRAPRAWPQSVSAWMDVFFLSYQLICTFISHFFDFPSFILHLDGRCCVAKGGQVMLCGWGFSPLFFKSINLII